MSPRLRAPVWPSRTRTLTSSSLTPRPSAAALPQHQRRAGRRIDLVAVMHLQDLDVEVGIERLRHLARERGQQVDAEAHVAGRDDGGMAGGGARSWPRPPASCRWCRARARCGRWRRAPANSTRGGRHREIEHRVDLGEQSRAVVGDDDAELAEARQQADVLAERDRAFLLDGAADHAVVPGRARRGSARAPCARPHR